MSKKKKDYPIVKYRIVTGNGYYLINGTPQALKDTIETRENFIKEHCKTESDIKRFSIQYIIKVTEEYIPYDCINKENDS